MADDVIYPEHLPERVRLDSADPLSDVVAANGSLAAAGTTLPGELLTLAEMEVKYVTRVLDHTGGNKQAAARILNIDRKTLSRILARGEQPSN